MRIFLSCQQALRAHAVPAYGFWEYYFKHACAEAGHEIIETPGVDWAEGLTPLPPADRAAWLARTWGRTMDFLRQEHAGRSVDLFLGYLYPDQVETGALHDIAELGIPTVNFFCDNVREFTRVPAAFRAFSLHWVPEAAARPLYLRAGLRLVAAPMPVWIPPELRTLPAEENDRVVFIGSRDSLREELLGEAVGRGLDLTLYGDGWRAEGSGAAPRRTLGNQFGFLRRHGLRGVAMRATYQLRRQRPTDWIGRVAQPALTAPGAYFQATRVSGVVIRINRYPSFRHSFARPGRYSRLRDIEAPMLGACYLTEAAPGLEELYQPGVEIETYRDAAELVEKAAQLLRDSAHRQRLRAAGQRRALAEHSISRSLERIRQTLGLPA